MADKGSSEARYYRDCSWCWRNFSCCRRTARFCSGKCRQASYRSRKAKRAERRPAFPSAFHAGPYLRGGGNG